jgi:hypothetical protein
MEYANGTKKRWAADETKRLTEENESATRLWNVFEKAYKDEDVKNKVLQRMVAKFQTTVYEVQRKLHNLR